MQRESVEITVKFGQELNQYKIRKGLGLQALKTKCAELEFDCNKGDCGICIFSVQEGAENLSEPTSVEKDFLAAMHANPEERLACQCRVFGSFKMEIEDFNP